MSIVGCPQLVACVVGLSRSNRKHSFETEVGIGKSCLCYKFMYPGVDTYNDDHRSLFALHEFESPVLNNTHFLYWGHAVKQFDTKSSEKAIGVLFHVVEQTVVYQDITLRPFNEQVSKPNVPDRYVKRITGQIESSGKISYKSRDDLALRSRYQHYPNGISRYPRGYLVVVDVSQSGKAFEDQFMRAELVLDGLMKQKKKYVVVVTKRDNHNPASLERALTLKRKYHTQVVETSALSNLNIYTVFRILAYKVLQKKVPGLSDHVPSYEEAAHVNLMSKSCARQSFLTFLKKRVVDSDERLRAIEDNEESKECVFHAGKLQTDRLFAEHVLELHSKKILLYTGVTENPELRREFLEEFVEQRSDLSAHLDVLRRWINSYMSNISDSDEPDLVRCDEPNAITTVSDLSAQDPEPYHTFHPNTDSVQSSPALGRASYTVITSDNGQEEHVEPDYSDGDLSDREYENYDPKKPALTPSTSEEPFHDSSETVKDPVSIAQQSLPDYNDVSSSCEQNVYQSNDCENTSGNTATQESTIACQELPLSKNGDSLATSFVHEENIHRNQDPGLLLSIDGQHLTNDDFTSQEADQQSLPKESEPVSAGDSRPEADQGLVQTGTGPNQSIRKKAELLQALLSGGVVESDSKPMTGNEISSFVPSQPSIARTKTETPPVSPKQQISQSKDDALDSPESAKHVQATLNTNPDDVYVNQRVEKHEKGQEEKPPLPTSVLQIPHRLVQDIVNFTDIERVPSDSAPTISTSGHNKSKAPEQLTPSPSKVVPPELPTHTKESSDTIIMSPAAQEATDPKISVPLASAKASTATISGEKTRLSAIRKKVEEKRRKEIEVFASRLSTSIESSPVAEASSTPDEESVSSTGIATPSKIKRKPPPPLPKQATQKQSDAPTVTSPHKVMVDILDIPPPVPPPPKPEDLDPVSTEDIDPVLPPPVPSRTQEMFELLPPCDTTTVSSMENERSKAPPSPLQNSSRKAPPSPLQKGSRKVLPPPVQNKTPSSPIQSCLRKVLPSTPQGNSTKAPPSPLQTSPKRSTPTQKTPSPNKPLHYKQSSPKQKASSSISHLETVVLKRSPAHQKPAKTVEIKETANKQDRSRRYPYVKIFEKKSGGGSKQSESNQSPEQGSRTVPTTFIRMDRRPLPLEPFAADDSDEGPEDEDEHDYEFFGPDYDHRDYVNIKDEVPRKTLDDFSLPSRTGISKWHSFSAADNLDKRSTDEDYPDFRNYKLPIPFQQSLTHTRQAPVPQGVWPDYIDGYVNTEINPTSSLPIFMQPLPIVPAEPRSGYPDYDYPDMRRITFRTLPTRVKPSPAGGIKGNKKKRPPLQNMKWDETCVRTKSSASDYVPMASISMDDNYINTRHPSSEDTNHDPSAQIPPRVKERNVMELSPKKQYSIDDMTVYMNLPAPPSKVPIPPRTQLRAKPSPIPSTVHSLQKSLSEESKVPSKPKPLPRTRGRAATDATIHDPSVMMSNFLGMGSSTQELSSSDQPQPATPRISAQNSNEERVMPITPTNEVLPPRNIRRGKAVSTSDT